MQAAQRFWNQVNFKRKRKMSTYIVFLYDHAKCQGVCLWVEELTCGVHFGKPGVEIEEKGPGRALAPLWSQLPFLGLINGLAVFGHRWGGDCSSTGRNREGKVTEWRQLPTSVYTAATALGTYSGLACGEAVYVLLQPALKETVFDLAKQSRDTFF